MNENQVTKEVEKKEDRTSRPSDSGTSSSETVKVESIKKPKQKTDETQPEVKKQEEEIHPEVEKDNESLKKDVAIKSNSDEVDNKFRSLKRNDSVAMRLSKFSSDDNLLDKFLQETEKILSHGLDEVKRTNSEFINNRNNERVNEDVSDSKDIKQVNDDEASTDVKSAEQEEDDDDECTFF